MTEYDHGLASIHEESSLLRRSCEIMVDIGGYPLAWVGLTKGDGDKGIQVVAQKGKWHDDSEDQDPTCADSGQGRTPASKAIRSRKPCLMRRDGLESEASTVTSWSAALALPLMFNSTAYGALNVYSAEPETFGPFEVSILEDVARTLAVGIMRAREHQRFKSVEEDLLWEVESNASVAELAKRLIMPNSLEDVSALVLEQARFLTDSRQGYVGHIDSETGYLVPIAVGNGTARSKKSRGRFRPAELNGPLGWVLSNRKHLMKNEVPENESFSDSPLGSLPILRFLSVPALIETELAGQIALVNADRDYTERDLLLIKRLAAFYALAIQRKRSDDELHEAREQLEKRVRERTAQLVKANETLQEEIAVRQQTQEEMKHAKEAAEAASQAKTDFLANMSHELRTPLNHIIGFSELIVDKQFGDINNAQEEYLNDVLESSRHLLSLINDILDLSKVEAGKLEVEWSDVDLHELFERSLVMVKDKAFKHGIQLSTDLAGAPSTIRADERKLKQVMYNLLSNAVKFTPDGGRVCLATRIVECHVRAGRRWIHPEEMKVIQEEHQETNTILTEKRHHCLEVSVSDTGIGLKAEDRTRVFKPFEQADGSLSRRYEGTGLGLSLTKKLVELQGGRIWVESEGEEKGSTFRFVIPL
jgi:signal transduction histidine kinase